MNTASIKKTGLGILIGILLMIGVQSVSAWSAPTGIFPNGNEFAPINTNTGLQTKPGAIGAIDFLASNSVDLGSTGWLQSPRGLFGPWSNVIDPETSNLAVSFAALDCLDYPACQNLKGILIDNDGNIQIKINNNPAVPGAQGAGKVLTSDAAGYATWQPADGGLPPGAIDQTLRHDGASWIATGIAGLKNNGTDIYQGVPDTSVGQGDYPVGNDGEVKINDPLYVGNNLGVIGKAKIYGNTQAGASAGSAALDISGKVKIVDGTQGADKVLTSDAAGVGSWGYAIPDIKMVERNIQSYNEGVSFDASCPDHYAAIAIQCDFDNDDGPDTCRLTSRNQALGPTWGQAPGNVYDWKSSAASGHYNGGTISASNDTGPHNNDGAWGNITLTCMRYEQ